MFDIGFLELVVILVLALLVLGPERLPKAARSVGYWFGKARRYVEGMKAQVESEFDTAEVKRLLHNQEVQIRELQGKLQENVSSPAETGINSLLDDDDPGNGHQELAGLGDESENKASGPQYDMIEEDDGSWGDLVESNPSKEELDKQRQQQETEENLPVEHAAQEMSKTRNEQ